jgi:hypothetical protein
LEDAVTIAERIAIKDDRDAKDSGHSASEPE